MIKSEDFLGYVKEVPELGDFVVKCVEMKIFDGRSYRKAYSIPEVHLGLKEVATNEDLQVSTEDCIFPGTVSVYIRVRLERSKEDQVKGLIEAIESIKSPYSRSGVYRGKMIDFLTSIVHPRRDMVPDLEDRNYFEACANTTARVFKCKSKISREMLAVTAYMARNKIPLPMKLELEAEGVTMEHINRLNVEQLRKVFDSSKYVYIRVFWVLMSLATRGSSYDFSKDYNRCIYDLEENPFDRFMYNPVYQFIISIS